MTGKDLAKAISEAKGKVSVPMMAAQEVPYIYAEKADLVKWARNAGEQETGMAIEPDGENWMLVSID